VHLSLESVGIMWNTAVLESDGESHVFGPEVLRDAKKQVQMIRENLKVAQSR
jgi:hypothetical protein